MIIFSGGTGTPKLLEGMRSVVPMDQMTVVVNTAEDLWVSGNMVCPDIDSVLYSLAGIIDDDTWWGIKEDTFRTHEALSDVGCDEHMKIGDLDRAVHILRSELLRCEYNLTQATEHMAACMGISAKILPMCNEPVTTIIETPEGKMHFQEFWVRYKGEPEITEVVFKGLYDARPTKEFMEALRSEDVVLIGPSNPITSIGPIISLSGIREILMSKKVIAVSPIIGDAPISGPAGKLMRVLGYEVSSRGVYQCYQDFADVLVQDIRDTCELDGIRTCRMDTLMTGAEKSKALAHDLMNLVDELRR